MNLRQLRSFLAVSETGTVSAAGQTIGLSHSAISQHIKALENELGTALLDRSRRPPVLTEKGQALVDRSRRMLDLLDEIAGLGSDESLIGALDVGVVPSTMIDLVPPALAELRRDHPGLKLKIRTGLSGELAARVRGGELDVAIATAPDYAVEGLRSRTIWQEPLVVIAPANLPAMTADQLLRTQPFIWFSRSTWAGQQIERRLLDMGLMVNETMEVDSILAVTALVRHGLGVSIIPHRANAPPLPPEITPLPFGTPQFTRQLAQIERPNNPKARLADALYAQLVSMNSDD
jgi:DNA-binding transcriptional LysR family regulator